MSVFDWIKQKSQRELAAGVKAYSGVKNFVQQNPTPIRYVAPKVQQTFRNVQNFAKAPSPSFLRPAENSARKFISNMPISRAIAQRSVNPLVNALGSNFQYYDKGNIGDAGVNTKGFMAGYKPNAGGMLNVAGFTSPLGGLKNKATAEVDNIIQGLKKESPLIEGGIKNPMPEAKVLPQGGKEVPSSNISKDFSYTNNTNISSENVKNMSAFRKFFTGGKKVLNRSGEGGQKLSQAMEKQRMEEDLLRGKWNNHIDTSLNGLSKEQVSNVDAVLRGEAKPIDDQTAGASKSLRNWFDSIGKKAEGMGFEIQNSSGTKTPFKMKENYAPQMYDFTKLEKGAQREQALSHLVKTGQARNLAEATKLLDNFIKQNAERRFGNLEKAREINLPGFIRDPKVYAKKYSQSIAKRFTEVNNFGMKDATAAQHIDQIAQEGGDYNAAQKIFDYTTKGAPQNKVVNGITQFNLATQLDLSAITNATQSINTAAKGGIINTIKGAAKGFTKEGKEVAELSGVYDDFIHSKETGVNLNKIVKMVMWPFQKVENFNRRTAANTGAIRAKQLAEGEMNDYAVRELQSLGINPANIKNGQLSKEDMLKAAYEMARKTQFKVEPLDVPTAWKTPAGKLFTQFQSFAFMQSKFIRDEILKEATKGNYAPLVRFIPLALSASYVTNYVRNLATGRDPKQANKDMDIRAWDKWGKAFGDFATGKIIQGKFLYDTFTNDYNSPLKKVSRVASSIGGPTIGKGGAILTALESMQKGFESNNQSKIAIAKGTKEAVDPYLEMKRYASGEIPFAGEILKNKAFAYPVSKYSPEEKNQFAKDQMTQDIKVVAIQQDRGVITPQQAQQKIQDIQNEYSKSVGATNEKAGISQTTSGTRKITQTPNGFSYFDNNGDYKTAKTQKQAQTAVDKMNLKDDLAGGNPSTVDKYPKGTLTTAMITDLYDNGDIDESTKYQLDSRIKKETKIKNAEFVKSLLDKKDPKIVGDLIKDGVLTTAKVDDMVETKTIPAAQGFALQMYLYDQKIKTGQIRKPSATVYNNYKQKYIRYYGLAKKKTAQPIQIPQKNLTPFYTK